MSGKAELVRTRNMAKTLGKIVNVLFWVLAIVSVVALCSMVVILFTPVERFGNSAGNGRLSFAVDGFLKYKIPQEDLSKVLVKPIALVMEVVVFLAVASWAFILSQLRGVLSTVENDRPFCEENARRIRTMGMILIAGSVIFSVLRTIVASMIVHAISVPGMSADFRLDLSTALGGLLLLVLAGVFRYGAYLQQEYDSMV